MALVLEQTDQEIRINGQHGEGGGQILRTALALAAAAGRTLHVDNVRARRRPAGLRPQHLQAAQSLRDLCGGALRGGQVGSSRLTFQPGHPVRPGDYRFDIGTAGSVCLLLHALLPALCTAPAGPGESRLLLKGGTHVPMAPTAGYLQDVWAPAARLLSLEVEVELVRPGFYPQGGGLLQATIPARRPRGGVDLRERRGPLRLHARAGVSRLPETIAERMLRRVHERARAAGLDFDLRRDGTVLDHGAEPISEGAYLELALRCDPLPAGFVALGRKGLRAEQVADQAMDALLAHLRSDAPVDPHLADQVLLLLALAGEGGPSRYRTSEVTQHLLTHADVLNALWPVRVTVQGDLGGQGEVTVTPDPAWAR